MMKNAKYKIQIKYWIEFEFSKFAFIWLGIYIPMVVYALTEHIRSLHNVACIYTKTNGTIDANFSVLKLAMLLVKEIAILIFRILKIPFSYFSVVNELRTLVVLWRFYFRVIGSGSKLKDCSDIITFQMWGPWLLISLPSICIIEFLLQ